MNVDRLSLLQEKEKLWSQADSPCTFSFSGV